MNREVRVGILGCANIAKRYAIEAFLAIKNAKLVAIASRDYEKAKVWALRFGIEAEKSYESLINNPEIDAVYIPLPIGLHHEWVLKAAKAKKHVICEKSLSDNYQSVKEIVDTCRKNHVVLYENFMVDFHPQHQTVLSLIDSGKIGRPFIFKGYFGFPMLEKSNFRYSNTLGGGSLNDAGAYTVFMARKILGAEPSKVTCSLSLDSKLDVDLGGSALLEFPNQSMALLAFSFNAVYQNNYSVWGSTGLINIARAFSLPPDMEASVEILTNKNYVDSTEIIKVPAANQFELIFSDFCNMILDKKRQSDSMDNVYSRILSQAKTLEAMRLSSTKGQRIAISEI